MKTTTNPGDPNESLFDAFRSLFTKQPPLPVQPIVEAPVQIIPVEPMVPMDVEPVESIQRSGSFEGAVIVIAGSLALVGLVCAAFLVAFHP